MTEKKVTDVLVLGAGIAGLSAGIYLKRAGVPSLVLEKGAPGGKLLNIHEIDNYPGLPHIQGPALAQSVYSQALDLGVECAYSNVLSVKKEEDLFHVFTDMGEYEAKAVIAATGATTKTLGIPGEKEFFAKGVSYCATCDGNFFRDKDVALIGMNDQAAEEALYLASLVKHVYFLFPEPLKAEKVHEDALKEKDNVVFLEGAKPKAILGEGKVTSLSYTQDGEEKTLPLSGVFPLYGERSSADFLAPLGVKNNRGFLVVDPKMATSLEGLFAAGDVVDKALRQAVTAAGEGAEAATSAIAYLRSKRKK